MSARGLLWYVNALVNSAAILSMTPLLDVQAKQLEEEFAVNVFGSVYMIQAVVEAGRMPPGGLIINTGSMSSKLLTAQAVYSAAKAASKV